jgi:hypothetical protein
MLLKHMCNLLTKFWSGTQLQGKILEDFRHLDGLFGLDCEWKPLVGWGTNPAFVFVVSG